MNQQQIDDSDSQGTSADKQQNLVKLFDSLDDNQKQSMILKLQGSINKNKRKRSTFEEDIKSKCVELWKGNRNFSETARVISQTCDKKIDESYVRRYVKETLTDDEIKQTKKKCKISQSHGKFSEMEEGLLLWFKEKRDKKLSVTMDMIKKEALSLFAKIKQHYLETKEDKFKHYDTEFSASSGWFRRFRERAQFSRRMATHTASTLAIGYVDEVAKFLGRVRMFRRDVDFDKKFGCKYSLIANMDETPVFFDMARKTTYHWRGERSISVLKTTGYRKRVTVCLAVLSNGEKLPPLVIFNGKTPPDNPFKQQMVLAANKNAWITEALLLKWVNQIWNKVQFPPNSKPLLLLDQCSSHKKASIPPSLGKDTTLDFIPAGCTSLVQPLDLSINKPFKDSLKKSFEEWLHNQGSKETNTTTKKKNLKAPSSALLLTWINKAWGDIEKETIINSFKYAGNLLFFCFCF